MSEPEFWKDPAYQERLRVAAEKWMAEQIAAFEARMREEREEAGVWGA